MTRYEQYVQKRIIYEEAQWELQNYIFSPYNENPKLWLRFYFEEPDNNEQSYDIRINIKLPDLLSTSTKSLVLQTLQDNFNDMLKGLAQKALDTAKEQYLQAKTEAKKEISEILA